MVSVHRECMFGGLERVFQCVGVNVLSNVFSNVCSNVFSNVCTNVCSNVCVQICVHTHLAMKSAPVGTYIRLIFGPFGM